MKKSMKKIKKLYKKLSNKEKAAMLWELSDADMHVFDLVTDEAYTIKKLVKEDVEELWKDFNVTKELGIE